VGGSRKSLFLWLGGSEKNRLFTDVLNGAPSPSHMHSVVLSIDQWRVILLQSKIKEVKTT